MANFNKVILAGNLTHNPELRYLPSGRAVANIRLAINNFYLDKEGNRQEDTLFIDVDFWERNAEICEEFLQKGSNILIEGELKLNTWTDSHTGEKKSRIRARGFRLQMLDKKPIERQENPNDQTESEDEKPQRPNYDDGIPF